MEVYKNFAQFYAAGHYGNYSKRMFQFLPALQENFDLPLKGSLLDIACGCGDFLTEMAGIGWEATGIDQSAEMLNNARLNAEKNQVRLHLYQKDMRDFEFPDQYDLITCWYDSLNYILQEENLLKVFKNAQKSLKPKGRFVFDMNTLYNLAVGWHPGEVYIQQAGPEILEIHQSSFDHEKQIATLNITGFYKKGDYWEKMDEIHQERGYPLEKIKELVKTAGLEIITVLGNIQDLTFPTSESKKVYFLTKKRS